MDELKLLNEFKDEKKEYQDNDSLIESIKPWDRDLLLSRMQKNKQQDNAVAQSKISEYFSVGTVIAGLNKLFESLYNVSFVPEATLKGEVWENNQVRKLKVIDNKSDMLLGYLYLDFWSPKVMPSHFTIVCLRRLHSWENEAEYSQNVQLDGKYQLPVISLVCNFRDQSHRSGPTLLSLDQVDTIFHEMGHAMHSMIGRTELHNLSGTRCATDFVEIPSVLMDHLVKICGFYQKSGSIIKQASQSLKIYFNKHTMTKTRFWLVRLLCKAKWLRWIKNCMVQKWLINWLLDWAKLIQQRSIMPLNWN